MRKYQKVLISLVAILSFTSIYAQRKLVASDIINELKNIEQYTHTSRSLPTIKIMRIVEGQVSQDIFKKYLNSIKGNHALNYTRVYDVTFKQFIDKMITFYTIDSMGEIEVIKQLVKLLGISHKQGSLVNFHVGFTARRIWTEFSFDHYFAFVFENSTVVVEFDHYF